MRGITYEDMRPGSYEVAPRLEDMDLNHLEASLCFPTFPRFCGQTFTEAQDKELALLCVKAYNDWMVEEWCGPEAEGRLIPLTLIPLWDAELAADEVRRNAARGVRAVCFSEIPPFLGLPSIHDPDHYWDPFFRACSDTGTVVNMHIGSSSKMPSTSADAPPAVGSTLTHTNATYSMVDFMFSGVLVRFPELKLAYAEGQIGWIPYILERADKVWEENRGWGGVADIVPEPPSTYFHRQIFGCFFDDAFGLQDRRVDRGRQHHLRVRLPPLRLDLAPDPRDRREADEGPRPTSSVQDRPGQRHQALRPRLQVTPPGRRPRPVHGSALHRRRAGVPGRAPRPGWPSPSPASPPSRPPTTGPAAAPTTPTGSGSSSRPATPGWTGPPRAAAGAPRRSRSSSSKRSSSGPTPPMSG